AQKVFGLVQHPASGGTTLVQLESSGLFDDVDHRVGGAAHVQRAAGLDYRRQRGDAVSQVALRRRACANRDLVLTKQRDVVLVHVDRVHRRQVRSEDAFALEQLDRSAVLDGQALLDL